jgi:DNA-binding transcriptional MocR family regulator
MVQSLGLTLDPRARTPLYQQLFDQVVARIRSSAFPAGFRLPPTRTLAKTLRTNRNTVVRAYEDLEAAGFVVSTVGRGSFVARLPVPPASDGRPAAHAGPEAADGTSSLPWASLLAHTTLSEPLSRLERLQRSVGPMSTDAINLSRLEPGSDMVPDELIRRCTEHVMRTLGPRALRYSAPDGLPRLRALISADLARRGVPAPPDEILVTSGSQQGLDLVARALLNPGDSLLVDETTFHGLLGVLGAAGARAVSVPADDEGPSLAALERMANISAKGLYLMPNSNNPTGACISAARREALVAWSRRTGVPLIEDDYLADLELDGTAPPPALRALDRDVIHIGSFSKRMAPGLRVGFMVVPPELRAKLVLLKRAGDNCTSELLQQVLAEFLERGYLTGHLAKVLPEYRNRRDVLEASLRRHLPRGLTWRHPARGLSLWLPLPPDLPPAHAFAEAQRKGVLISPGSLHASVEGAGPGIRVTFCAEPPARLTEGGRRLGRALSGLVGRGQPDGVVPSLGGV